MLIAIGIADAGDVAAPQFNVAQAALDKDGDGALSKSELAPMHARWFKEADLDASGGLSPAEFHGLLASLLPPRLPEGTTPEPAPKLSAASGTLAWSDIDDYVEEMVRTLPLEGASVVVLRKDKVLHAKSFGLYDLETVIPIASATKWLNAALVMTVVDEGKLELDKPISEYLDWASGPMGAATLRQLLSHTAGFATNHLAEQPRDWTLEQSARDAFAMPPIGAPSEQFRYGGAGMQVAGYLAEKATGVPYAQLFKERITGPLGMSRTYIGFAQKLETPESITNPIVAAGGYSTAADYSRFLEMLVGGGTFRGKTILSKKAIAEMFRDYSDRKATLGARTNVGSLLGYGLGAWCNEIADDGAGTVVQSGGAFGTSPIVDVKNEVAILLMTKDRMPLLRNHWKEVTDAITAIFAK
ncbi:MAG: serine hydrolase [Pirellulaceae bacterium]|nr:serine hydrolase [Pirellulaceae bacterium]